MTSVFDGLENIVRRGENAGYQYFPIFPLFLTTQQNYLSKPLAAFPHVKTIDSGKREIYHVKMIINSPGREYWPSRRSNQ